MSERSYHGTTSRSTRKEGNILFTVIWHWTCGKVPLRYKEGKLAAATLWATFTHKQQGVFYMDHPIDMIIPRPLLHQLWSNGRKEGNVLFNDALNTFYLRLYGVRHMVKDHSDSEKGNPLPPHRLLFPISSNGYFICTIPQTG